MITFSWKVKKLNLLETVGEKTDVVYSAEVLFKVITDDTTVDQHWLTEKSMTFPFTYTEGNAFTQYESLTEDMILSWIQDKMQRVEKMTYEQITGTSPKTIQKELPWGEPEPEAPQESSILSSVSASA